MRELRIGGNEAGQRLDKLLRKYLRRAENGFLYKMLRKKNITLNGRKASGKELLKEGDLLKLFFSEESFQKLCAPLPPLPEEKEREEGRAKAEWEGEAFSSRIVYEDENLLLFNKPAGLLSQSDRSGLPSVNELCLSYLMEKGELGREQLASFRPGAANRLDRNTTGLLLFGKTLPALQELSFCLKKRTIGKYYLAVVRGHTPERGRIEGLLRKDPDKNRVFLQEEASGGAKEVQSEYRRLFAGESGEQISFSVLLVHLISGKTHQIRAHLASVFHPILGDPKYGDRDLNRLLQKRTGLRSQLLHACELHFPKLPEDSRLSYLSEKNFYASPPRSFLPFLPKKYRLPEGSRLFQIK